MTATEHVHRWGNWHPVEVEAGIVRWCRLCLADDCDAAELAR